jgi:DNA-binding MarR family transcriptional regulator
MSNRQELITDLERSFRTVFRMFRRELNQLFEEQITGNDLMYLKFISEKETVIASALSQEFNVSTSHITAVTDRLVKRSLIKRKRSESDRRIVKLCITNEGTDLVEAMEQKKHAYMEGKFERLSDTEMEELVRLMNKLL